MIKKITLIILLLIVVISCGKKNEPKYIDPDKKVILQLLSLSKLT